MHLYYKHFVYNFEYSVSILRWSRNRCQMWTHAITTASISDTNSLDYNGVLFLLFHLTRVALYECCIINQQSVVIPCTQSQCIYTIDNCNIILRIVLILINVINKFYQWQWLAMEIYFTFSTVCLCLWPWRFQMFHLLEP